MSIIRIYSSKSKQNKKPGWKQQQDEYDAWVQKVSSMKTNFSRTKPKVAEKVSSSAGITSSFIKKDFSAFVGGGTKSVARPEIQYADNPEMLERELNARKRKFNVAPAYNKAGAQFVSEEELVNTLRTNKRRS